MSLASLAEVFFSLFLLIHLGQTALLTAYGSNPPTSGTITYPAKIVGIDLTTYTNPLLTATFDVDFFLGVISLTIVGVGILLKMLQEKGILASNLPGIREFFLTPPYRRVWLSTSDQRLNPLSSDPEDSSDAQLLESFERIYKTVQPGGTVSIIIPSSATTTTDRFQKLLQWTGFSAEKTETIYRVPENPETQLMFTKPRQPRDVVVGEPEPQNLALGQAGSGPSVSESPPQLDLVSKSEWVPAKLTRTEKAMLKSAISILSRSKKPMPYHELLNEVYLDMVEKRVEFDSARQIETTLLKHTGRELVLAEEPDEQGLKKAKKWALGVEDRADNHDRGETAVRRIAKHRPRVPSVAALLRKWRRKPRYRPKPETDE